MKDNLDNLPTTQMTASNSSTMTLSSTRWTTDYTLSRPFTMPSRDPSKAIFRNLHQPNHPLQLQAFQQGVTREENKANSRAEYPLEMILIAFWIPSTYLPMYSTESNGTHPATHTHIYPTISHPFISGVP